jgi:hypothetical protein
MSLICDYETLGDNSLCSRDDSVQPRFDSSLFCDELCNGNLDCLGYLTDPINDMTEEQCWIILKEAPMLSTSKGLGGVSGLCHVKVLDSCRESAPPARQLGKCDSDCVLDILLAVPILMSWIIIGFFVIVCLCGVCVGCADVCCRCNTPAKREEQSAETDTSSGTPQTEMIVMDKTESGQGNEEAEDIESGASLVGKSLLNSSQIEARYTTVDDDDAAASDTVSDTCQHYFL